MRDTVLGILTLQPAWVLWQSRGRQGSDHAGSYSNDFKFTHTMSFS